MAADGRLKAVILDMDGTLLDTLDDLAASTNAALAAHGLPTRGRGEVRRFVGNGYARLVERAVPPHTADDVVRAVHETFLAHYAAHGAEATAPYPGVRELLARLREAGVARAVVSNKGDQAVRALVRRYLPGLVDVAIGEREGVRRKPAPDAVRAVMRGLGVSPGACAYVGDSEVDVATAAAAGVRCIAVTWGFRTAAQLREAGATTLVASCDELLAALLPPAPARGGGLAGASARDGGQARKTPRRAGEPPVPPA